MIYAYLLCKRSIRCVYDLIEKTRGIGRMNFLQFSFFFFFFVLYFTRCSKMGMNGKRWKKLRRRKIRCKDEEDLKVPQSAMNMLNENDVKMKFTMRLWKMLCVQLINSLSIPLFSYKLFVNSSILRRTLCTLWFPRLSILFLFFSFFFFFLRFLYISKILYLESSIVNDLKKFCTFYIF